MEIDEDTLVQLDRDLEDLRRRLRTRLQRDGASGGPHLGRGFHILAHLIEGGSGAGSPTELADTSGVRTSTMAAHIDRLEEAGYVRRSPRDASGRVEVRVTPEGRDAYRRYLEVRQSVLRDILAPLAPAQTRQLADLLARALARPGAPVGRSR